MSLNQCLEQKVICYNIFSFHSHSLVKRHFIAFFNSIVHAIGRKIDSLLERERETAPFRNRRSQGSIVKTNDIGDDVIIFWAKNDSERGRVREGGSGGEARD